MSTNGTSGLSSDELRAAVRAVLREVLPDGLPQGGTTVAVTTDGDLDALVRRVAEQCEDPATRAAYREGRHGFRLAETAGRAQARPGGKEDGPRAKAPTLPEAGPATTAGPTGGQGTLGNRGRDRFPATAQRQANA